MPRSYFATAHSSRITTSRPARPSPGAARGPGLGVLHLAACRRRDPLRLRREGQDGDLSGTDFGLLRGRFFADVRRKTVRPSRMVPAARPRTAATSRTSGGSRDMAAGQAGVADRAADLGVVDPGRRVTDVGIGDRREAVVCVVLLQLPVEEPLDLVAVVAGQPAPVDEHLGQGHLPERGPRGAASANRRASRRPSRIARAPNRRLRSASPRDMKFNPPGRVRAASSRDRERRDRGRTDPGTTVPRADLRSLHGRTPHGGR